MTTPPTTFQAPVSDAQEMADRMDYLFRRMNGEAPQTRLPTVITERQEALNQRIQEAGAAAMSLQNSAEEIIHNLIEDAQDLELTAPEREQLGRLQDEMEKLEMSHSTLAAKLKAGKEELAGLDEGKCALQKRQKELERLLIEKEARSHRPNKVARDILGFGGEIIKRSPAVFAKKVSRAR